MNHQPFEEWLLSDDELDQDQEQALNEHLETCTQCPPVVEAWKNVLIDIKYSPEVSPTPGFTQRFEARLAERRAENQQRWTLITLLGFCLGAIALSGAGILVKYNGLPSPVALLTDFSYTFIVLAEKVGTFWDVMQGILGSVPLIVPLFIWISISVSLFLWVFIWFVSVWRLPHVQRSFNK
jgi:hypothetical protein